MIALSALEQDALTEIFNIGVGIAADAMYQISGEHIPLSVPEVALTTLGQAKSHYQDLGQTSLLAIRQTYQGAFTLDAMLMFQEAHTPDLARMMVGQELAPEELAEVVPDAMAELGNIIMNAVISHLASSLEMKFEGTLPDARVIPADRIFKQFAFLHHVDDAATSVLALMIDFELNQQRARGHLAFLLDPPSIEKLVNRLDRFINGPSAA